MKCRRDNTAVLVVDYQEKLIPAISDKEALLRRSNMLLKGLKTLGIPMIISEQYSKGLGVTVPEIREAVGDTPAMEKGCFSCWDDEGIREAVLATGCQNILVCGTEAHICVLQSAIDMKMEGKDVLIVEDCVGSRFPHDKEIGLRRAEQEGIRLSTAETVLFELTKVSGTPEFKIISKLVK
ncbi:MAG: hydrolase [Eubacteriales bacterium]|nr:hydrolase [Eubacteriales bacterium]